MATTVIKPRSKRYKPKTRLVGFRRKKRPAGKKKLPAKSVRITILRDEYGQWAGSKRKK